MQCLISFITVIRDFQSSRWRRTMPCLLALLFMDFLWKNRYGSCRFILSLNFVFLHCWPKNARMWTYTDFMALVTAMFLCAKFQDSLFSISVFRVHVVFSTAEFKDRRKPCPKTPETAVMRRGIQTASPSSLESNASHWCTVSWLYHWATLEPDITGTRPGKWLI